MSSKEQKEKVKVPKCPPNNLIHSMKSEGNLMIPEGIYNLLKVLYREVLREQPKDLLSFMAIFLEEMLIMEEPGRIRAASINHVSNADSELTSRRYSARSARAPTKEERVLSEQFVQEIISNIDETSASSLRPAKPSAPQIRGSGSPCDDDAPAPERLFLPPVRQPTADLTEELHPPAYNPEIMPKSRNNNSNINNSSSAIAGDVTEDSIRITSLDNRDQAWLADDITATPTVTSPSPPLNHSEAPPMIDVRAAGELLDGQLRITEVLPGEMDSPRSDVSYASEPYVQEPEEETAREER